MIYVKSILVANCLVRNVYVIWSPEVLKSKYIITFYRRTISDSAINWSTGGPRNVLYTLDFYIVTLPPRMIYITSLFYIISTLDLRFESWLWFACDFLKVPRLSRQRVNQVIIGRQGVWCVLMWLTLLYYSYYNIIFQIWSPHQIWCNHTSYVLMHACCTKLFI